jgi:site-specific DNA-cytosine methylase
VAWLPIFNLKTMQIKINPSFEALIPPLSSEEFAQLEQNCIEHGIIDPLVVWAKTPDEHYLVDGHNRFRIAKKHNLSFETHELNDFADEDEAMDWMDKNQLGRRNLSQDMMSYIRGRMYERTKKAAHRPEKGGQNVPLKTAEKIAEQTGVTDRTIKRDAQYFKAVEKIAEQMESTGPQLVHMNITSKKDAPKLARIAEERPEILKHANIESAGNKNLARDIIHEFERNDASEMPLPKVCPYDSNMFYQSAERSDARYGDKVFSLSDSKYNTVSTLSRFFHTETGIEFSLREYAAVQTFPPDYKFMGNYTSIKRQIGNAVAPHMGAYISALVEGMTIGDLFAGCGGFSAGAHANGFTTKWAVEWDENAAQSFKLNFTETKVYQASIKALDPASFERVDVIIGGPPCQGFSSANHENKKVKADERFADDPRNELYKEFLRFVAYLKPAYFIMENVPEIQDVEAEITEDFQAAGYSVNTMLVAGNDIGMKQNRKRFFFIGKKNIA